MIVSRALELTIYGQRFFALHPNDPQLQEVKNCLRDAENQTARVVYMLQEVFSRRYVLRDQDRKNPRNWVVWKDFRLYDEKFSFGEWYNDYDSDVCIARETGYLNEIIDSVRMYEWFRCENPVVPCDPVPVAYLKAIKL